MYLTETTCLEEGVYQFTFAADAAEFATALEVVYQQKNKTYTLEGYAKGQAPRAAIEEKEGTDYFYFDAINALLAKDGDTLLNQALAEADLTPVTMPDYDVTHCDETGFTIQVTVGVLPPVTLGQYKGLTLYYPRLALPDDAVENQLNSLRTQVAKSLGKQVSEVALDDAFAQLVSEQGTIEALRAELAASFERYITEQSRRQGSFMLLEKIGQTSTMPLPKFLFDAEYQKGMQGLLTNLAEHGISLAQYLADCGKTQTELETEYANSAMRALRGKLAIYAIAKAENITVTPVEVESEQVRLSASHKVSVAEFMAEVPAYMIKNDLILQRTLAFLSGVCTLQEANGVKEKG